MVEVADKVQNTKSARRHRLHLIIGCAAILVTLTGCSKGPLDIKCSEFLTQSADQQLTTAAKWGHPSRDGSYNAGDELAAGQYVQDLRSYCQQADHSDDSLQDLEIRLR